MGIPRGCAAPPGCGIDGKITAMSNVSLFIGGISAFPDNGRPTGMFKHPLTTAVLLGREGFAGDQQGDRSVHGGPEKAVHLYPASHYARLAAAFPQVAGQLLPGSLGENISCATLDESRVHIGQVFHLGEATLQVCQPRNPCWKIDERYGVDGMAAYIAEHLLTGWYWRVITEGVYQPGDCLRCEITANEAPTLREAMLLWQAHRPDLVRLQQLADTSGISSQWRDKIERRIAMLKTLV